MKEQWTDKIYYGGDYNPDQWDDETIEEDMRLFQKAGINLVTLPVFSWAKLEPEEGVYDFGWLDKLMDQFAEHQIAVCLATPTTAQPAWLSTNYPEVLPVDIAGRKRTHGMRVFFCYNSEKYRERAVALAEEMAKRYGSHPALAIWHVSNEYGTYCYCPHCQDKFRLWLRERYGSIERLNEHWHTAFWGRTVYRFEEITLPTELNDDYRFNPAIQLDYMRFVTDSTVECFLNEQRILKKYTPDIPVQSNMSGFIKKLDQFKLTKHMDIVGFDNYPSPRHDRSLVALKLDIMRGLKAGKPFMVAEQSPNQQNWQPYNKLKKPGEVRRLTYQAMAHGADACLFFQLRQSAAGQEKFHGAVISHSGREDTRVFEECSRIGQELKKIDDCFIGARTPARVGLLFDWNNWWALENSSGPSKDMDYLDFVHRMYKPFYDLNIPVDIISYDSELTSYQVIAASMVYMMKDGVEDKLREFTAGGGTVVGTTMTGIADENDRCLFGAYPGPLREVFGLWIEETDALYPEERNHMFWNDAKTGEQKLFETGFLCDRIRTDGATVLARYEDDFYAGEPCITVNQYGAGSAYYIGTSPEEKLLHLLIRQICEGCEIHPLYDTEGELEVTKRQNTRYETLFVINHGKNQGVINLEVDQFTDVLSDDLVSGVVTVQAGDVRIFRKNLNESTREKTDGRKQTVTIR